MFAKNRYLRMQYCLCVKTHFTYALQNKQSPAVRINVYMIKNEG